MENGRQAGRLSAVSPVQADPEDPPGVNFLRLVFAASLDSTSATVASESRHPNGPNQQHPVDSELVKPRSPKPPYDVPESRGRREAWGKSPGFEGHLDA